MLNIRELKAAYQAAIGHATVLSLPVRERQYLVWDGGSGRGAGDVSRGLHVLVSPLGTKSYRSMFYFAGDSRSYTRHLGRVGEITLAQARELNRRDRAMAKPADKDQAPIDPRVEASSRLHTNTYVDAVEDYVVRFQIGNRNNVSAADARRVLLKAVPKGWHTRTLASIRPTEIEEWLEVVRDGDANNGLKPRPYLANTLHSRLRTLFAWCAKNGIDKLAASPMLGIDKPSDNERRRERDWFKKRTGDEAIRAIWAAADKIGGVEGQYLKVLLLTGERKTALAEMKWEEIDKKTWFWDAPPG